MTSAEGYALFMAALGAWSAFKAWKAFRFRRPWAPRRWEVFLAGELMAVSSFVAAAGLHFRLFHTTMLLPLGLSLLWMTRLPCYFPSVDRIAWLHHTRNAFFVLMAALCFGLALQVLPVSLFGI